MKRKFVCENCGNPVVQWGEDGGQDICGLCSAHALTIGTVVREHRLAKGMTQKALAEKCGTYESAISDIETGKRTIVTLEMVMQLHWVLDIDFEEHSLGLPNPSDRH